MGEKIINNKWKNQYDFNLSAPGIDFSSRMGIFYLHLNIPDVPNEEVVLILNDPDRYILKFKNINRILFEMFYGFERTANGPIMYYLFAISDKATNQVEYILDKPINIFSDFEVNTFYELANQEYIHLLMMGPGEEIIKIYEIQNSYDIGFGLDLIVKKGRTYEMKNYELAVNEYYNLYTPEELYKKKKQGFDIIAI